MGDKSKAGDFGQMVSPFGLPLPGMPPGGLQNAKSETPTLNPACQEANTNPQGFEVAFDDRMPYSSQYFDIPSPKIGYDVQHSKHNNTACPSNGEDGFKKERMPLIEDSGCRVYEGYGINRTPHHSTFKEVTPSQNTSWIPAFPGVTRLQDAPSASGIRPELESNFSMLNGVTSTMLEPPLFMKGLSSHNTPSAIPSDSTKYTATESAHSYVNIGSFPNTSDLSKMTKCEAPECKFTPSNFQEIHAATDESFPGDVDNPRSGTDNRDVLFFVPSSNPSSQEFQDSVAADIFAKSSSVKEAFETPETHKATLQMNPSPKKRQTRSRGRKTRSPGDTSLLPPVFGLGAFLRGIFADRVVMFHFTIVSNIPFRQVVSRYV